MVAVSEQAGFRGWGAWLTSQPLAQYRKSASFYLRYDSAYLVGITCALVFLFAFQVQPLLPTWQWWFPIAIPFVLYFHTLASVFIHNASHGNFPKAINRTVGEICGLIVLSRFASWQIIHQRHHMYSDDPERDPHPVLKSYWKFVWSTLVGVERQLQQQYFEVYGDTTESRRYEQMRAYVSYATGIMLIALYWRLFGNAGFFFLVVPANIFGVLFIVHFNWSTHGATLRDTNFSPVNLNHGIYKLGNLLWFGIYMHKNHHKRASEFNPAKMSVENGALPVDVPTR